MLDVMSLGIIFTVFSFCVPLTSLMFYWCYREKLSFIHKSVITLIIISIILFNVTSTEFLISGSHFIYILSRKAVVYAFLCAGLFSFKALLIKHYIFKGYEPSQLIFDY